jgi:transposase
MGWLGLKLAWESSEPPFVPIEHAKQNHSFETPPAAVSHDPEEEKMQQIVERCAGLDVHRSSVVACVRVPKPDGQPELHLASFGATTPDLLALRDWLVDLGVSEVAMEATGVYWKPVYYVLEDAFSRVLVVNARNVKQVPGRKTDQSDAEWLCQLLAHGLLRGGFVPPPPIRDLRDLTRRRKTLIQERQREANRLHKVLEDAGIKLGSVASDVLGASGKAMLGALVTGTRDAEVLADLARGKLRAKLPELEKALTGRFRDHHAFMVSDVLAHLDYLEERIAAFSARIEERLAPFAAARERWMSIPGIGPRTAEVLIAELGVDLPETFPTAGHLASWAGLAPATYESAGKRRPAGTTHGNKWVRGALYEAAMGATRRPETDLGRRYRRLHARRGHKRAIVAVSHAILTIGWQLERDGALYTEPSRDQTVERERARLRRRALRQLSELGYDVELRSAA